MQAYRVHFRTHSTFCGVLCVDSEPVREFNLALPGVITDDDRKGAVGDRDSGGGDDGKAFKDALLKKCQAEQPFVCPMCHRPTKADAIAVDHMNENHAQTTASNLRCLCTDCNGSKTKRTMALYRANGGAVPMTNTDGMSFCLMFMS